MHCHGTFMIQPNTMASSRLLARRRTPLFTTHHPQSTSSCLPILPRRTSTRPYSSSKDSARARLKETKIQWYWLPATAGIAFIGGLQSYRMYATARDQRREMEEQEEEEREGSMYSEGGRPKRRKRVKPDGPWYVSFFHSVYLRWCWRM